MPSPNALHLLPSPSMVVGSWGKVQQQYESCICASWHSPRGEKFRPAPRMPAASISAGEEVGVHRPPSEWRGPTSAGDRTLHLRTAMLSLSGRGGVFVLRSAPHSLARGLAYSASARSSSRSSSSSGDAETQPSGSGSADAAEAAPEAQAPIMNKGAGAGATTVAERNREYLARTQPKTPREAVDRKLAQHEWIRPRINPNVLLHGKDSVEAESVYEYPYRPFRLRDFASIQSILHVPDPILDSVIKQKIEPSIHLPKTGEVQLHNLNPDTNGPIFRKHGRGLDADQTDALERKISQVTPLSLEEVRALHRYTVELKRVVHQTKKGRVARYYVMVVAGNGRGMVGVGQGNAPTPRAAGQAALVEAVKSMDFIERYEGRTIPLNWENKFSATKVFLRPRPAGTYYIPSLLPYQTDSARF